MDYDNAIDTFAFNIGNVIAVVTNIDDAKILLSY